MEQSGHRRIIRLINHHISNNYHTHHILTDYTINAKLSNTKECLSDIVPCSSEFTKDAHLGRYAMGRLLVPVDLRFK